MKCVLNYIISGVLGVYLNWLNNGCKIPDETIVDFIVLLTEEGISGLF